MDSMLSHIKDIVEQRDAILYDHIHKHVVKRCSLHMSLPQNIILHLGWPNLHLMVELGKDHTQIQRCKMGICLP